MSEGNSWRIDSEHTLKKFQEFIEQEWKEKHYLTIKWHSGALDRDWETPLD